MDSTTDTPQLGRRQALKLGVTAGAGLILGFGVGHSGSGSGQAHADVSNISDEAGLPQGLNAYIQVRADGKIIIQAPNPEIGQGVKTALPMIVAEELDADWNDVEVVQAATDRSVYVRQVAGGSRSIPESWDRLRLAGATARAMLVNAAAASWNIPVAEITTRNGQLLHSASGRSAGYGDFAEAAARLSPPGNVTLKSVSDFSLLGRRITGVDNHALVTGQPLFGIDQRQPGMLYAVYVKAPATGGKVGSANLGHVKTLKGVKDVFVVEGNGIVRELMPGVAIVADSTWAALKARRELQVEWDLSEAADDSWTQFVGQAQNFAAEGFDPARFGSANGQSSQNGGGVAQTILQRGDVAAALQLSDARAAQGVYTHHFVSHAQLEPQNTLAYARPDGVLELWSNTQHPDWMADGLKNLLGLRDEQIVLHQARAGGGFGRRLYNDPVCEAAVISQRMQAPVLLQWTREDDMLHDMLRSGGVHAMKGAVDAQGKLLAFEDHLISFTAFGSTAVTGGELRALAYPEAACDNALLAQTLLPLKMPCGAWRAPRSNTIAWAQGSFLGELAAAGDRDQLEFLLEIMQALPEPQPQSPGLNKYRAMDTVREVAQQSGWGRSLPEGQGMGIAFYYSHGGHIAEVVELSVDDNKRIRIHQVTVAADVGPIVNLSTAEALLQGSVVDALSTLMAQEITYEDGQVEQDNFHRYPLLRIHHTPPVAVHFIQSDNPPTGLGEPAIPPLAPALGNAIYIASGQRPRTMPLAREGYSLV